jgi:hypothetical protein
VAFGAFVIGFQNDDLTVFDEISDFAILNNMPGQFYPGNTNTWQQVA